MKKVVAIALLTAVLVLSMAGMVFADTHTYSWSQYWPAPMEGEYIPIANISAADIWPPMPEEDVFLDVGIFYAMEEGQWPN